MGPQILPILRSQAELTATAGERLYCPALDGHPVECAEYLALLPVQDSNGRLLAALEGLPNGVMDGACVGVLAADPFRPVEPFLGRLSRAGVRAVANFPTTAMFDGETGEALRSVGLGPQREFAFLGEAARAGFSVTAFVTDAEAGRSLREAGAGRFVVHPGAASGDPVRDAEAAQGAAATAADLRGLGCREVFVYVPAGFEALRPVLAAQADGLALLAGQSSNP